MPHIRYVLSKTGGELLRGARQKAAYDLYAIQETECPSDKWHFIQIQRMIYARRNEIHRNAI